jgi:hypothetical protein
MLEATAALEERMEIFEDSQKAVSTAAESSKQVATGCAEGMVELRKTLDRMVGAVWGEVGLEGAACSGKPLIEDIVAASSTYRQACTEEMLNAVRSLASQVCLSTCLVSAGSNDSCCCTHCSTMHAGTQQTRHIVQQARESTRF